ncbi:aminotransferase class V-fold PLP-dependent enzyme [Rudanella lutea]|uniref:aminotransferase class V-fold PLP-dependent enzyme n=1 Tax=Rudanella lutea TaxID=451374 RepID=UPI00036AFA3C|nr:aminotransferase class V-fold PLP-dependent enzyme [Rudanella lutea]
MITQNHQLTGQKEKFSLPAHLHYINCATRGPFSRAAEQAGIEAIRRQTNPFGLTAAHFFEQPTPVRQLFSRLINNPDPDRIAIIPSVSYGMGVVARNLHRKPGIARGQEIILLDAEFPSDVYAWDRVCAELGLTVRTVPMPTKLPRGAVWNDRLLEAIGPQTALVVAPPTHWMYGIRVDLEAVARRAREVGAWLAIDGTQAVGAMPFDLETIQPDALICAGYKWLMGPYSTGLAYYGEAFDDGVPLEESWMARLESDQFHKLSEYQPAYRPKAYRYNVGEQSHFIHMPMLEAALTQLLDWQPARIEQYGRDLMAEAIPQLQAVGCGVEETNWRTHHLLGIWLPDSADPIGIQQALLANNVSISVRGRAIRVAPHVYNDANDVAVFVDTLVRQL